MGESQFTKSEQEAMNKNYQKARDRAHGRSTQVVVERNESKMTPEAKAYSEQLRIFNTTPEPARLVSILGRVQSLLRYEPRQLVLPYEEAKIIVDNILRLDLERKAKLPLLDAATRQVYEDVTRYFIGDPDGPIPLHKNLFIYGNVGVGKDFLMKAMNLLCRVVPIPDMQFDTVSTKDLIRQVSKAKNLGPLDRYEKGGLLLEDLGEESKEVRVYADKEKPIDYLLSSRYIGYTKFNLRTHITSNLQPDEIEEKYGTRMYDRFKELYESIFYEGESKRE